MLAAALFLVGTNAFVIAGVLPDVAATFDVSTGQAGYAIAWYAGTVAVLGPVMGMTLARVPREVMVGGGLALVTVGTAVAALAPGLGTFIGGRAVAAVGGAALVPTVFAAVPRMVPHARRGRALSFVELGFALAVAVGAPLGTVLANIGSWRLAMLALTVLAALVTVAAALVVRDLPPARRLTPRESAVVLVDQRLVLLMLTNLLLMLAFNLVYTFSSVIAGDVTGDSGVRLAGLLAVCGIGGLLGTLLGGPLTDRWGSGRAGVAALGVFLASVTTLVWWHSGPLTWVLFLALGASSQMAVVPQLHRLFEVRPAVATVSTSWNSTAMYVGVATAPVVGARLLPGGPGPLAIGAAAAALAALVVYVATLDLRTDRFRAEARP
ncbi:MFS transporter [Nocardioides sp. 503]|uniref:MFS transporter n=1 Tax=Nocardioides sp. 503 TaxID=2508326 RepID=UPI001ADAC7A7|nr:MFS transporter [Nocardioides sp. 503]